MPTPQRINYHIAAEHAGSNRQAVADAQISMHGTVTTILDDHKSGWFFTQQIRARSPETEIIHRVYMQKDAHSGWDGNLWEAPNEYSPTKFLDAPNYISFLIGLGAPPRIIHQVLCEAAVRGDKARVKVAWLVSVIKEASRRNVRLCVDNVQPVIEGYAEDVASGVYDPLWHALAQHPEHLYGIHEYWLGDAWHNTSADKMKLLPKAQPMDVGFLQMVDSAQKAIYVAYPNEAHLGRCEVIAKRCRQIGVPIPRMVYTEIGVDHVRLEQIAAVEAINGRKPLGYPTMSTYWHIRYPSWSPSQTFTEMCRWLNRAMPDYVIGACLFGFDTSFENGNYHLEQSGANGLQALLTRMADEWRTQGTETPTIPPVVTLPPTIPSPYTPVPPPPFALDWQTTIPGVEREYLNAAKNGQLTALAGLIMTLIVRLNAATAYIRTLLDLLDERDHGI
jgi:hypothetical protein